MIFPSEILSLQIIYEEHMISHGLEITCLHIHKIGHQMGKFLAFEINIPPVLRKLYDFAHRGLLRRLFQTVELILIL